MIILEPIPMETIWGGNRLFPCAAHDGLKNIGQLYTVQCRKSGSNRILNGEWKGKTLFEYYETRREALGMSFEEYPLLIALVDAKQDLSVQVHPDDACAELLENAPFGKTESWYFIKAPEEGCIVNGCRCHDREKFNKMADAGEFAQLIDHLKVCEGDYVYVEAGTLHALKAGSMVYEIQENVDFTYRFYDYGRKAADGSMRPLHLEKAKKAVKPELKSSVRHYSGTISERKYKTRLIEGKTCTNTGRGWEMVTVLSGEFLLEDVNVRQGMTVLLEPGETMEAKTAFKAIAASLPADEKKQQDGSENYV